LSLVVALPAPSHLTKKLRLDNIAVDLRSGRDDHFRRGLQPQKETANETWVAFKAAADASCAPPPGQALPSAISLPLSNAENAVGMPDPTGKVGTIGVVMQREVGVLSASSMAAGAPQHAMSQDLGTVPTQWIREIFNRTAS
jgi:hypothetical protein